MDLPAKLWPTLVVTSCVTWILVMFTLSPVTLATAKDIWRSSLYPKDWEPGYQDDAGRFMHDFSYAGYYAGERPLPASVDGPVLDVTKPPYNADNTGKESATLQIQRAINDVSQSGGGTIFLPPGTYRLTLVDSYLSSALLISHSNVVLKGAGPERTFLFLDETHTSRKALLRVAPPTSLNWYSAVSDSTQLIREDLLTPTTTIPLDGEPAYQVGDWVALTHDTSEDWVREHFMIGLWPPGKVNGQLFFRQVVAVDTENDSISIDTPTRYSLKTRDKARVYRVSTPLSDVGIEGFSFGMRENPNDGWADQDYRQANTGASQVHGSRGITLRGVVDSWVQDVKTYKPLGNKYAHIQSIGIELAYSRRVTVRRVSVENPQYLGGGGNGYPFVVGGEDNLLQDVVAINGRHSITLTGAHTHGNVILGGYARNPVSLAADFHAFLSTANLIDNMTLEEERFEAGDRTGASGVGGLSHGLGTTQSVFWNINGLKYKPDTRRGDLIVWSEQYGWGYVIGTRGPAFRVGTGTGIRSRPVDLVEGEGKGELLDPQSLYIDQLERRLKREGKTDVWEQVADDLRRSLQ